MSYTPQQCTPQCRPGEHYHVCLECAAPFVCKRSDGKFCSLECSRQNWIKRHAEKLCTYSDCTKRALPGLRSGYCEMHYRRAKDGRDMDTPPKGTLASCVIPDCDRKPFARGLCQMHHLRKQKGQPLGDGRTRKPAQGNCIAEGCDQRARSQQLCQMHLQRFLATGETGSTERMKAPFGTGCLLPNGYRQITVDGKKYLEHRFVMEHIIGRPLKRHETVHHMNGMRADNRPENLELWVKGHPYGQRPEDLIAFVVENYAEATRAALEGKQRSLWTEVL